MGEYGASGGYWISSDANEIVAEPSTLTGSIGVFGGKLAIGPALAKFGVDLLGLKVGGDYADSGRLARGDEIPVADRRPSGPRVDRIYNGFVARVAEGRKMETVQQVGDIAKGHVWTWRPGPSPLGLVDYLGGFPQAVDRAKALAGIKGAAQLEAVRDLGQPFRRHRAAVQRPGPTAPG